GIGDGIGAADQPDRRNADRGGVLVHEVLRGGGLGEPARGGDAVTQRVLAALLLLAGVVRQILAAQLVGQRHRRVDAAERAGGQLLHPGDRQLEREERRRQRGGAHVGAAG